MTESLADGPDWHLRSGSRSGLSLFSAVDEEVNNMWRWEICDNQVQLSSDESPGRTIQIRS